MICGSYVDGTKAIKLIGYFLGELQASWKTGNIFDCTDDLAECEMRLKESMYVPGWVDKVYIMLNPLCTCLSQAERVMKIIHSNKLVHPKKETFYEDKKDNC